MLLNLSPSQLSGSKVTLFPNRGKVDAGSGNVLFSWGRFGQIWSWFSKKSEEPWTRRRKQVVMKNRELDEGNKSWKQTKEFFSSEASGQSTILLLQRSQRHKPSRSKTPINVFFLCVCCAICFDHCNPLSEYFSTTAFHCFFFMIQNFNLRRRCDAVRLYTLRDLCWGKKYVFLLKYVCLKLNSYDKSPNYNP